jgi:hypothetical protein
MTDLLPCPFCGAPPETPFENLRDIEDDDGPVKVWTMHHHCLVIDMWVEGSDAEECASNWIRLNGSVSSPGESK